MTANKAVEWSHVARVMPGFWERGAEVRGNGSRQLTVLAIPGSIILTRALLGAEAETSAPTPLILRLLKDESRYRHQTLHSPSIIISHKLTKGMFGVLVSQP